ncbi:unnamed protein product, partial [Tilletia caries]
MSAPAVSLELDDPSIPAGSAVPAQPTSSSSSPPSTAEPAQNPSSTKPKTNRYTPFNPHRTERTLTPPARADVPTESEGAAPEPEPETETEGAFPPKLKTKYFLKSSTDIGNGEASASLQGRLVHFLGGLETLQGSASVGSRTKRALDLNFTTPIQWNPNQIFTAGLFSFERDNVKFSSAREAVWGGRASLLLVDQMGDQHDFVYEAACRNIGKLVPGASIGLRQQARTTSKSSLSYTYTRDSRDSPLEPEYCTKGSLLRSNIELAGPGGDARFLKLGTESVWSRRLGRLGDGWSTTMTARAGLLRTTNAQPSHYPDRAHLGGPTSVRMFSHNGLGPKDGRDSLGGDAHWSTGVELGGPVWKNKAGWPVKWHLFLNAGQLALLDQYHLLSPPPP